MRWMIRGALLAALALGGACDSDDVEDRIEGTMPGDCDDGADNDGDGLFDCDDDSCAGAPGCNPPDAGVIVIIDAPE